PRKRRRRSPHRRKSNCFSHRRDAETQRTDCKCFPLRLSASAVEKGANMRVDIITIFPRMFEGVLSESMLKIAQEKQKLRVNVTNLRDFTTDRHKTVDD